MKEVEKELRPVMDELWKKIEKEAAGSIPIPEDLTESEETALFLMRMQQAGIGEENAVQESELEELFKQARHAKAKWCLFRGAMAGIFNLTIQDGKLMVALTQRFRDENPHLGEQLKAAGYGIH